MAAIKKLVEMVKETTHSYYQEEVRETNAKFFQDTLLNFIIDITTQDDSPLEYLGCLLECKLRESVLKSFKLVLNETVYASTNYQLGIQSLEFYLPGNRLAELNTGDLKTEYLKDLKPFLSFEQGKREYSFDFSIDFSAVKSCMVISIETKRIK